MRTENYLRVIVRIRLSEDADNAKTAIKDEKVESWFEVPGFKPTSTEAWNGALQLYDRLASTDSATYKSQIGLARILGFLGRWNDCESELAKLFAKEKIAAKNRLDPAALNRKPELLTAYLEWGFAMQLATGGEEKARRARATDVFERVVNSVQPDQKHWWHARFGHIQSLFDRGLYDQADVSMSSLERTNPDFDGDRYGLKARLRSLKLQITGKQPKKAGSPPPTPTPPTPPDKKPPDPEKKK